MIKLEELSPVKRVEHYLYALCVMDFNNIPIPRSRLEFFAHALITGVLPEFQAETREEVYITAIITGDYANLPLPKSRADQLLYKICLGETEIRDIELETRYEMLLAYIAEHGDMPLETVLVECVNALQTIPNTVEMPVKSAILKGQTLVNLLNVKTISGSKSKALNMGLKSNTKYIFIADVMNDNENQFNGKYVYNDETMANDFALVRRANNGKVTNVFTTPNNGKEIINMNVYFVDNVVNNPMGVDNMVIIEYQDGMENWDIPYFEGMTSVKMPVLTTTGKNLNNQNYIEGNIDVNTGIYGNMNSRTVLNNHIKIKPNTKYSYQLFSTSLNFRAIYLYDINKNFIGITLPYKKSGTFDSGNAYYINFCAYTLEDVPITQDEIDNANFMIVEDETIPTSYEPCKSNILTVNEDVTLRKIGDVQDTLDLTTGEYTQAVYEYTFTGDEVWGIAGGKNGGYSYFNCFAKQLPVNFDYGDGTNAPINCNRLPILNYRDFDTGRKKVGINLTYSFRLNFSDCDSNNGATVEDLKTYLKANPTTVQYPISKSVKTVDLTIKDQDGNAMPYLSTFNDVTHVSINAVDIIPQVDLEVRVDANTMANVASQQENVAVAQASLSDAIDAQNDDIEMTQNALDEVKGE